MSTRVLSPSVFPMEEFSMKVAGYEPGLVDPLNKGLGSLDTAVSPAATAGLGWNLLAEELSLPTAVLYEERLEHNLRWMQRFVKEYGVNLAPHGKTTMAPKLFRRQLA